MKEQIFIMRASEGLAIPRQNVYANLRGEIPMPVDSAERPQIVQKPKEPISARPVNGEQHDGQKVLKQIVKLEQTSKNREKSKAPARADLRKQLKPHLDDFRKKMGEQAGTMQVNDIKREIVALHQAASKIERSIPKEKREELWKEVYGTVKDAYGELERRGVNTNNFAHRELLAHEADGQVYAPPGGFDEGTVLTNAAIEDSGRRIKAAEKLLQVTLEHGQPEAIIAAHKVSGEGVYKYTLHQKAEKMKILRDAKFNERQIRTLLESGIAGVLPAETFADLHPLEIENEVLRNEAILFKATADAGNANEDVIARRIQTIEDHMREGRVRPEEAAPVIAAMEGWKQLAERTPDEGQLEQQMRMGRRGEPEPEKLSTNESRELGFDPTSYTHLRDIADRVESQIREGQSTNNDFITILNELTELRPRYAVGDTEVARESNTELSTLFRQVKKLKDSVAAKDRKRILDEVSQHSMYGEMRMPIADQEDLVRQALSTNKEDLNEVHNRLNSLFRRADINSRMEWRDAMGSAGQIESEGFYQTLDVAASGKVDFKLTRPNPNNPEQQITGPLTSEERKKLTELLRELRHEADVREALHNLNYYVNQGFGTEDVAKAAGSFKAEDVQYAYATTGVATINHLYEQAIFEVIARHQGYLPYSAMIYQQDGKPGEVEALVREYVAHSQQMGMLINMEEWEINRAVSLARGMGVVSGRFFEIVAQAGVSQDAPLTSWWANDIIKQLAFFKQVARYNIGKEANRFLLYKLDKQAPVWSIGELADIKGDDLSAYITYGLTEPDNKDGDRYLSLVNPFNVGSVFTQTGWRYGEDEIQYAGAVARLLEDYKDNPIIGLGMWIEKNKGKFRSHEHKDVEIAEKAVEKQLELAAEVTPLKFFYNLPWFEKKFLETHYRDRLQALVAGGTSYEQKGIGEETKDFLKRQFDARRGLIGEMGGSLRTIALMQEKLIGERVQAYREYLQRKEEWVAGGRQGEKPDHPDFFGEREGADPRHWKLGRVFDETIAQLTEELGRNPGDHELQERLHELRGAKELAEQMSREFKKPEHSGRLMNDLKHRIWRVPFVFGTDDIPADLFDWVATGGSTLKRRWGDIASAAKATGAYEEMLMHMPQFHDHDSIIKALDGVYNTLRGHDENVTREVMYRTVEGITKFFKKGWQNRLPFGIGTGVNVLGGSASYAQKEFGREAMAWDETQTYEFIHKVRAAGLITEEQLRTLEKSTGSRSIQVGYDVGRTVSGLLFLGLALYMFTKTTEEK